jgi:hypothetical protein
MTADMVIPWENGYSLYGTSTWRKNGEFYGEFDITINIVENHLERQFLMDIDYPLRWIKGSLLP